MAKALELIALNKKKPTKRLDRKSKTLLKRFLKSALEFEVLDEASAEAFKLNGGWLPRKFKFDWVTKEGRLITRIEKYLYKTYKIKTKNWSSKVLEQLGQLCKPDDTTSGEDIHGAIRTIAWKPGDYGDDGSCFWGCHKSDKLKIKANGGRGFVLHNSDKPDDARGRCLIAPYNGAFLLFNCYTKSGHKQLRLEDFAAHFKTYLSTMLESKKIAIQPTSVSAGVYFNNSSNFLVGDKLALRKIKKQFGGTINFL